MRKCVTGKCTNQSEEEIIYQGHCLECANLHLSNVDPRFKFLDMTYEEVASLRAELAAVRHAAHMPDDYEHGLPSWINQHLYGKLLSWTAPDGGPIRRSEDIQEIIALKDRLAKVVGDNNHLRQAFQMLADEITVHSIDEPVIIRRIQAALEAAKE
jgi:hypothetical protein